MTLQNLTCPIRDSKKSCCLTCDEKATITLERCYKRQRRAKEEVAVIYGEKEGVAVMYGEQSEPRRRGWP